MNRMLFALGMMITSIPAAAQVDVGYPPPRSPFRDLEFRQEATLFGGYFISGEDPAGVAPRSAPLAGFRYEIVVGGPAQLVARIATARSERMIIDPTQPIATRNLGVQSWPIYFADAGISVNLTGQRTFRGVVPVLYGGLGVASDAGKKVAADPYRLGTTFALAYAAGLRFVPGGRLQVRADVGSYMYQIKYPTAYYVTSSDNTAVLDNRQARNFWKNNPTLTLGVSYLLFR